MTFKSKLSSKGQVTIPHEVRAKLGLREGDQVEFVVEKGQTFLRPMQPQENPFAAWAGALPAFADKKERDAWLRDLRDPD